MLGLAGGKDRVNSGPHGAPRRSRRFPGDQAHFHEFPEMSHWLVGEPEAPDVSELTLQWLDARGIGAKAVEAETQATLVVRLGRSRRRLGAVAARANA